MKSKRSVVALAAMAVFTLVFAGRAAAAPKQKKLAVMDIGHLQGVPADTAKILTNIVVAEIARAGGFSVISTAEISAMIGFEKQKQLLGCTDNSSCLAEIGGALGVDYFLNGQVGKIGSRYHLNLTLTDVVKATVVTRETRYAEFGNEDQLVVATEDAVRAVFSRLRPGASPATADPTAPAKPSNPPDAPAPAPAPAQTLTQSPAPAKPVAAVEETRSTMTTTRLVGWIALGVGAAVVGGGVLAGLDAQHEYDELAGLRHANLPDYAQIYQERKSGIEERALLADILYAAGGVTAAVGLVMVLVGGNDDAPVAISPSFGSQGLGLAATGNF